jgi:hypothetical protein
MFWAVAISARYFLMNLLHCAGVSAESPSFMDGRLGARLGNQTSYQFCEENLDLGTPRGGRRTVPMRKPSSFARGLPSLTMRMAINLLTCSKELFQQREDPEISDCVPLEDDIWTDGRPAVLLLPTGFAFCEQILEANIQFPMI